MEEFPLCELWMKAPGGLELPLTSPRAAGYKIKCQGQVTNTGAVLGANTGSC